MTSSTLSSDILARFARDELAWEQRDFPEPFRVSWEQAGPQERNRVTCKVKRMWQGEDDAFADR